MAPVVSPLRETPSPRDPTGASGAPPTGTARARLAEIARIGCSSWTSEAWRGRVYPRDLPDGERLRWYARFWNVVEVDSSYYRDPGPYLPRRWAQATPPEFRFTLKFPRDLLDPKKPVDAEKVATFLAHARLLGAKLGAVLLQFPPWVKPGRATPFLDALLERLEPDLRYSVELRDAGWFTGSELERLSRRLEDRRIALAWSYLTYVDVPPVRTTDFAYVRFIGDHTSVPAETHGEIRVDRRDALATWARHLERAAEDLASAFVLFNNHFAGFAPRSVNDFRAEIGLPEVVFGSRQPTLDGDPPSPA